MRPTIKGLYPVSRAAFAIATGSAPPPAIIPRLIGAAVAIAGGNVIRFDNIPSVVVVKDVIGLGPGHAKGTVRLGTHKGDDALDRHVERKHLVDVIQPLLK